MEQPDTHTAAACSRQTCDGCEIQGKLLCVHTLRDLVDFYVVVIAYMIPFLAGMIIGGFRTGLAAWVGLAVVFFGYIEARVLCRHCPHYAEEGFLLRCHANWGLPKIPKLDPRPMSRGESAVLLLFFGVLFLYYVPFFIVSSQWLLLVITTSALVAATWTVLRTQCTRCYHLSCPLNRVPEDVREAFYRNYPAFAEARHKSQDRGK